MLGRLARSWRGKPLTTGSSTTRVPPTTTVRSRGRQLSAWQTMDDKAIQAQDVTDNPCWGSPDACALPDLLPQLAQKDAILFASTDYLVLNKPADLRMDGPYQATVHKLLTHWYPPPSLRLQKEDKGTTTKDWLALVATYHRHSDHPDNELRPCHQLDYATSGVLLVARSKAAASSARQSFEDRKVDKAYLALLHGHVELSSDWPVLEATVAETRLAAQEDTFRRSRKKRRQDTFQGYVPPHALYQQWQRHTLQKPRKKKSKLSDDQWNLVWSTLETEDAPIRNPELGWNHVKKMKQTEGFIQAAKVYNEIVGEQELGATEDSSLPLFFRIRGDEPDCFHICAPLGEVEDDFSMRLPPSLSKKIRAPLQVGTPDMVYKPSLTKCVVQSRGTLRGKNVTKVRLLPRTGRRHQLRVHTALAGHAIVGDRTYEPSDERDLCNRMCLHSQMLQIPLEDKEPLHIQAPDPFLLDVVT
jgi:23S rRNA-/tRNA-specific pseudouridylate synthase